MVPLPHPESSDCAASAEIPTAVYSPWIMSMQLDKAGLTLVGDEDQVGLLRGCVVLAVEWGSSPAWNVELDTMVEISKPEL